MLRQLLTEREAAVLIFSEKSILRSIILTAEITAIFCFNSLVKKILIVDFMKEGTIKIPVIIKFTGDDSMKFKPTDKLQDFISTVSRKMQVDTDRRFLLEMNSEGNLRITGITDIKGYDESNIVVISVKYVTEITGRSLFMKRFSDTEIIVSGEIDRIDFIRR